MIDKTHFRGIMAEFPPKLDGLKELAEELRQILFPIRDELLFTGTIVIRISCIGLDRGR
jgi:hypothetical protein